MAEWEAHVLPPGTSWSVGGRLATGYQLVSGPCGGPVHLCRGPSAIPALTSCPTLAAVAGRPARAVGRQAAGKARQAAALAKMLMR